MADVLIGPGLGQCLFLPSAASKVGVSTIYILGSSPQLRTGTGSVPLQEASGLSPVNIDLGGDNKARISTATWRKTLDHVNAADQEKLRREGVGVTTRARC